MSNFNYKRLFLALNLPEDIKEKLGKLLLQLRTKYPQVKWVKPKGLHLTLHFLGETDNIGENKLKAALGALPEKGVEIKLILGELGAFPNLKYPRVIFIKIKELDGNFLSSLHKEIGGVLEKQGIKVDSRPWQAHITLGRVRDDELDFKENINFKDKFKLSSWELMESELTPAGANYKIIASYLL